MNIKRKGQCILPFVASLGGSFGCMAQLGACQTNDREVAGSTFTVSATFFQGD